MQPETQEHIHKKPYSQRRHHRVLFLLIPALLFALTFALLLKYTKSLSGSVKGAKTEYLDQKKQVLGL